MTKLSSLLCAVLYCTGIAMGQSVQLAYPFQGFTTNSEKMARHDQGWIVAFSECLDANCNRSTATVINVSTAGQIQWQRHFEPAEAGQTQVTAAECLPDGRVFIILTEVDCYLKARVRFHWLAADGSTLWDKVVDRSYLPDFTDFMPTSAALLSEPGVIWVGGESLLLSNSVRLKLSMADGTILGLSREESFYPDYVKAVPVNGRTWIRAIYDGVEVYENDELKDTIKASISQFDLGEVWPRVRTFPVSPHLAITDFEQNLVLADLNGDTSMIKKMKIFNLDIQDGKFLVVSGRIITEPHLSNNKYQFYTKAHGKFRFDRQIVTSPLYPNFDEVIDLKLQDDQLLLTARRAAGVVEVVFPNQVTQFSYKNRNQYLISCSVNTTTQPTPFEGTDVSIDRVVFQKKSWWYSQNITEKIINPEQISVTIRNNGTDVLRSVSLYTRPSSIDPLPCFLDTAIYRRFDQLDVLPGDTTVLVVDDLPVSKLSGPDKFCVWLSMPNDQPDAKRKNDSYCTAVTGFNLPLPDQMRIFPNPVQDQLFISLESNDFIAARIQISNMAGQIVLDEAVLKKGDYYVVNTATLATGVYILRVGNQVKKIWKA